MIANTDVVEKNEHVYMMIILANFRQQCYLFCPSETTTAELLARLTIYR